MERWVNDKLDARLEAEVGRSSANLGSLVDVWIDTAIRKRDLDRLTKFADDPDARRRILQKLLAKPRRGRPPRYDITRIQLASEHVDWVREIWREHYGKQNRAKDNGPAAIDIVLRRFEKMSLPILKDALTSYRRKHGRFSRP